MKLNDHGSTIGHPVGIGLTLRLSPLAIAHSKLIGVEINYARDVVR